MRIFFDVLAEFATQARNPDVTAIEERFRTPVRVAVLGRRGVGRESVTAALAGSGVKLSTDAAKADVRVLVIAEALKPEELEQLRAAPQRSTTDLVVLNKADLIGVTPDGPLAFAERRAAEVAAAVNRPVAPMIAHLAGAEVDDEDLAALRLLAAAPADMTSTDAFVDSDHLLPTVLRRRLLEKFDRFGLTHAVAAVAAGATGATVARQLRALSQVDRVIGRLTAVTAPVRYGRIRGAVRELGALAAQTGDESLEAFLSADEVLIAVMAAAVDVMEAAGFGVDRRDRDAEADGRLHRAVHWATYAKAPVDIRYQRCATDIARGSLRLLGRVR